MAFSQLFKGYRVRRKEKEGKTSLLSLQAIKLWGLRQKYLSLWFQYKIKTLYKDGKQYLKDETNRYLFGFKTTL